MLSFWEKESLAKTDYLIVGGGIVGLSTAASLIEKEPEANITVIERGVFPSGASTKNAGFACFGSISELVDDLKTETPENVAALVEMRWQGIQQLRKRLGDEKIGLYAYGGYELLWDENSAYLSKLEEINKMLQPIFGENVFEIRSDKINSFGFDPKKVKSILYNKFEAQINTGEMMNSLIKFVTTRGVRILTGTTAEDFVENSNNVTVQISTSDKVKAELKANKVAFCTNAFTKKFFPTLDIVPGRGQVLVTKPIEHLKFKGVFHYDEGYFYFRNIGNRVIFGGGRNLDYEAEKTEQFGQNDKLLNRLHQDLKEFILPNTSYEIDYNWSGIMAFGKTKTPIIEKQSERVVVGARLGGMGVAIGTTVGENLVEKLVRE